MSPVFAARRRADEFDALVEARASGQVVDDARFDELLDVVGALRSSPRPAARPEFVADLRERLMIAAATELAPRSALASPATAARLTVAPQRSRRERRIAVAIGGLAIVGASSTMAVAAQSALPGDVLYPLKRAIENAQTGVSTSDERRGEHLLSNAAGRLAEADALTRDERGQDLAAIESTLTVFTEQASEASEVLLADYLETGDESSILELQQFTVDSMSALENLSAVLPTTSQAVLVSAGTLLTEIDQATQQLCPTCSGSTIGQVPAFLVSAAEGLLGDLLTPTSTPAAAPEGRRPTPGKDKQASPGQTTQGGSPSTSTPSGEVPLAIPSTTPAPGGGKNEQGGGGSGSNQNPLGPLGNNLPDGGTPTGGGGGVDGPVKDLVDGVSGLVDGLTDPLLP
ncbi:hypothetical protein I601_0818 [Nocardioides dokdonensis FR1436]|uniref:DUF5667 domain-containing protein n=1 Tax=Nocardioides dokdonensis FR1436 TaxID=1300347 RepID=A0A1A9GGA4_9ACTN|nr:DUF5667 domain-containing protein [Nocardioides dokdonensis]ANH37264.1 hypothetical protein I601_0818 [Nocardioides dokdonensis FR1436]